MFDKWYKEEENLSGALNMKLIKQKNLELRQKLDAWKKRAEERKRLAKRAFEHGKKLREAFEKRQDDFNIEKEKVIACVIDYNQFKEAKERCEKEEKIINDFLCQLPEGGIGHQILEIKDLERVLENETRAFKLESQLLRDFAGVVRTECVMNQHFFSFYDIPDLIVKKKYQRKEYEQIIKLLNKVKKSYLVHKATIVSDKPVAELVVTDEDLVPLELFDQVLQLREAKQDEKKQQIVAMIAKMKSDAQQKIKSMGVDTEKTKKIVENSVFIHSLNQSMEALHSQLFTFYYKHQLLYLHFVVQQPMFKAAREFEGQYLECLRVEKLENKFNKEWRDRLQKEIMRFNGKSVAGGDGYSESISDNTSEGMRSQKAQQQRPKSAMKAGAQTASA